jgi:methylase of polypeptide subunit release factors
MDASTHDPALAELLLRLAERNYRFVTVTPATHKRILARRGNAPASSLRDVFGWSVPFAAETLPAEISEALARGGLLIEEGPLLRSAVRVSTVRGRNYLHSRFPTEDEGSVFLGPDTYRFANLIADELERHPLTPGSRIVDIGTGAGVGAMVAAELCTDCEVLATDVNAEALRLARANAAAAGVRLELIETSGLDGVPGDFDLALLNPPYMADEGGRTYRDGGRMHGGQLSVDLAKGVLPRLRPGGLLILYTGSAIVEGRDRMETCLRELADTHGCALRYRELDPDVFGEELVKPHYAGVERIAVVSAVFTRSGV